MTNLTEAKFEANREVGRVLSEALPVALGVVGGLAANRIRAGATKAAKAGVGKVKDKLSSAGIRSTADALKFARNARRVKNSSLLTTAMRKYNAQEKAAKEKAANNPASAEKVLQNRARMRAVGNDNEDQDNG